MAAGQEGQLWVMRVGRKLSQNVWLCATTVIIDAPLFSLRRCAQGICMGLSNAYSPELLEPVSAGSMGCGCHRVELYQFRNLNGIN